jgi:N-acetylneuraminic acid mutarotase
MPHPVRLLTCVALGLLLPAAPARAHFPWLVPSEDGQRVELYFSESTEPDDPELLKYVREMTVRQATAEDGKTRLEKLPVNVAEDSVSVRPDADAGPSLLVAAHTFGVLDRGGETFLLQYYAKTGPEAGSPAWQSIDTAEALRLDLVPRREGEHVAVRVLWDGEPLPQAEVTVSVLGQEDVTGKTDKAGEFTFAAGESAVYGVRVKHVEAKGGSRDGKSYASARHYATLALPVDDKQSAGKTAAYPELPQAVTSFGGAVADGALYVYGGHTGSAHSYSNAEQGDTLRRLKLQDGAKWEELAQGPPLQGLAMVAHEGNVYRLGGFTAKNAEGEEHDLWSQDAAAVFDPKTGKWNDIASLPEPRSSFDAAVLGDAIYVIGGWQLAGDQENEWHETAWKLDLSQDEPKWTALPKPPFQRRALAVAAHDGKIYAIGGMQLRRGNFAGPTTRVDVFDPKSGEWSEGPSLKGEKPMAGFGSSAFATGGRLYVSTIEGDLQRLSEDGKQWEVVAQTPTARFFHRMLPIDDGRFVVVGGANMAIGKFTEVEVLSVR